MDTRSAIPKRPDGEASCVYCGKAANTRDHTPPKCFLRKPLPSNLMTLPACQECNGSFSFDENVVRAILTLVSAHPALISERRPGGRLERAMEHDRRLQGVLDRSRQPDGNYGLTDEILSSFERVFCKTAQGLFFGLYERVVPREQIKLVRIENRRLVSPDDLIDQLRPPSLEDITDEPVSEISPRSWHVRQPVVIMKMQPLSGGPSENRVFRVKRETPVVWQSVQDVFKFAFVKHETEDIVCVLNLWETLLIAVAAPWPDGRGPLRRGKNNPDSRDHV